ncbi:MAG: hypothetical protein HW421_730 [Ignavibacteria bacterium]|nr:hypothetical protein [Ignavibacteria bacterium]
MKKNFIYIVFFFFAAVVVRSQNIEDALRFTQTNGIITPRSGGLNVAFHGLSDDFSAVAFNPAGLTLITKNELSFGFGFLRNSSETEYLTKLNTFNSDDSYISHAGIVVPFKIRTGNAGISIGYYLENNFDNNYRFEGFNPTSTMINHFSTYSIDSKMTVYNLFLCDSTYWTPIKDSLQQSAIILESGGLHNIAGGAAFELAKNISLGFSIVGKWGGFNYSKEYSEWDKYNKYNETTINKDGFVDLNTFKYHEKINQSISGIGGSVGLMTRVADFMRIGVTVKFPTFFDITEKYSQIGIATFDNGDEVYDTLPGENAYKVRTPFIYCAGASVHAAGLTFTAGVEFSDVTQMEFSDGPEGLEKLNTAIIQDLVAQTTWGFGVEYEIPLLPITARASYSSTTSPYGKDIAGASLQNVSLGAGIFLADNLRLDGLFRWTDVSLLRTNYGSDSQFILNNSYLNVGLQLTYRYR